MNSNIPGMVTGEMGAGIKKPGSLDGYFQTKLPKGHKFGSFPNYNPMQKELNTRNFENVAQGSYLDRLAHGDQGIFDEIEAPAHRQFQGAIGQLASRFSGGSGRGSLGTRHGSGACRT